MIEELVIPASCSIFALVCSSITNSVFLVDEERSEVIRWYSFPRDMIIVFVKFLFLTLFFFIAVHRIILTLGILLLLFILVNSKSDEGKAK